MKKRYIHPIHIRKLFSNSAFIALVTLILLLAIPLTVYFAKQRQSTTSHASAESATFTFTPQVTNASLGQTLPIKVFLSASAPVTGVDVTVQYDPALLDFVSFQPTASFSDPLINNGGQGIIRIASVDTSATGVFTAPIELGTISMRTKIPGTTTISYQNATVSTLGTSELAQTTTTTVATVTIDATGPTPTPILSDAPTPTNIPTVTTGPGTPTPTSIPTNIPTPSSQPTTTTPPNTMQFALTVTLPPHSAEGNTTPLHTQRDIHIQVLDQTNTPVVVKLGTASYNSTTRAFSATLDMGTILTTGQYTVKVHMPGYLRRQIPGIQTLTAGVPKTFSSLTLTPGDINDDNVLNILDYNLLAICYNQSISVNCQNADIDDNGKVDGIDYNYFIRSLSTLQGD